MDDDLRNPDPFIRSEQEEVLKELDQIRKEVMALSSHQDLEGPYYSLFRDGLVPQDEVEVARERVIVAVDYADRAIERLIQAPSSEARTHQALIAASSTQAIRDRVDVLAAYYDPGVPRIAQSGLDSGARKVWDWLRDHVKPIIEKVSKHLWQLICGLVTPKSWTIGGELGTGILGLASVKVSITFGPGDGEENGSD